ncbi:MAG: hypothetical protein HYW23_00385 [Candidatus Aenigmarchaeota archaeon]|nr:hypothetical protein [Candidatus Aenigmarchaeota archaeon]
MEETKKPTWRELLKSRINERYGSITAYSQASSMPRQTIGDYLHRKSAPTEKNAKQLYDDLGIEQLKPFFEIGEWYKDLEKWLTDKKIGTSEFARTTGIKHSTISNWLSKRVKNPYLIKGALRKKMYDATGLKYFAPVDEIDLSPVPYYRQPGMGESGKANEALKTAKDALFSVVNYLESERLPGEWKHLQSKTDTPPKERVSNVRELLLTLIEELEHYKHVDDSERRELTKKLDPKLVGYLTTLANALYSDQEWKRFVKLGVFRIR